MSDEWVMVPREPTEAMCRAGESCDGSSGQGPWLDGGYDPENVELIYKAMLAAAPAPTVSGEKVPSGWTLVSNRHFQALATALSEILATARGESDQPILDIIEWCMKEVVESPQPRQGFDHPAPTRAEALEEALRGMIGLCELVMGRDDLPPTLKTAIEGSHRLATARALAGEKP